MDKKKWFVYILGILPLLMVLAMYARLPDLVPLQWNASGVSRYGKKSELFLVAVLAIFLAVGMPYLQKIDPRRQNYEKFQGVYEKVILGIQMLLVALTGVTIYESIYPNTLPVGKIVMVGVGMLFVFIGNLMPKVKSNFFMGYKVPWTLSNEVVWYKTHRLGGKCFFIGGLLIALAGLFFNTNFGTGIVLAVTVVVCIYPMVMSYFWYQEEMKKNLHE